MATNDALTDDERMLVEAVRSSLDAYDDAEGDLDYRGNVYVAIYDVRTLLALVDRLVAERQGTVNHIEQTPDTVRNRVKAHLVVVDAQPDAGGGEVT